MGLVALATAAMASLSRCTSWYNPKIMEMKMASDAQGRATALGSSAGGEAEALVSANLAHVEPGAAAEWAGRSTGFVRPSSSTALNR